MRPLWSRLQGPVCIGSFSLLLMLGDAMRQKSKCGEIASSRPSFVGGRYRVLNILEANGFQSSQSQETPESSTVIGQGSSAHTGAEGLSSTQSQAQHLFVPLFFYF